MRAHATAEASETFARGVARDPYPLYEVLRDAGPVVWSDEVLGGAWVLTRYADIVTALQDPRLSAARADAFAQQLDGARQRQLAHSPRHSVAGCCSWTPRTTRGCARH